MIRVLKDCYGVFQEPVTNRPYYVRFKQLETGRMIQGMTHAKGTAVSPLFLGQILERFEITAADFIESLGAAKKESAAIKLGIVPKPTAST